MIRHGCKQKDFYTCYSYFFYKELSSEEKKFAKKVILEQCNENSSKDEKAVCEYVGGVVLK